MTPGFRCATPLDSLTRKNSNDLIDLSLQYRLSLVGLEKYATLDHELLSKIQKLVETISAYAADSAKKRPLNFLMVAEPGTGKSHLVKCIANKFIHNDIVAVTYNMASLRTPEDLLTSINTVRNLKVEDKLPILFLDEFDSDKKNIPLLLPLMWDGELNAGQQSRKLGKIIIILAGSNPSLIKVADGSEGHANEGDPINKMDDFFSRINGGVINIPGFLGEERSVDKVCIAISLLQNRFGKQLKKVPISLLKFIYEIQFQYGVRSLEQFIGLLNVPPLNSEEISTQDLTQLPLATKEEFMNSPLLWHLKVNDGKHDGVVKKWKKMISDNTMVVFSSGIT